MFVQISPELETIDRIYDAMDLLSNQIAESLAKKQEVSMKSVVSEMQTLKSHFENASTKSHIDSCVYTYICVC